MKSNVEHTVKAHLRIYYISTNIFVKKPINFTLLINTFGFSHWIPVIELWGLKDGTHNFLREIKLYT